MYGLPYTLLHMEHIVLYLMFGHQKFKKYSAYLIHVYMQNILAHLFGLKAYLLLISVTSIRYAKYFLNFWSPARSPHQPEVTWGILHLILVHNVWYNVW